MAHHGDYLMEGADQHGFDRSLVRATDWSKSTDQDSLTRLVEKGCLTREKSGKLCLLGTVDAGPEFRLGG